MASVTERVEAILEREAPSWGIRPVPAEHRHLSGLDLAVLWGDLSVGLLVMVTGALLVPALGFPRALLAIVVGSLIGCVPLAVVGLAGEREGVPSMVLFRPVLGRRGSFLPSALNLLQLVGWTAVEFWAMGRSPTSPRESCSGSTRVGYGSRSSPCCARRSRSAARSSSCGDGSSGSASTCCSAAPCGSPCEVLAAGDPPRSGSGPGEGGMPVLARGRPRDRDAGLVAPARRGLQPLRAAGLARRSPGPTSATSAGNVWFYALGALLVLGAGASAGRARHRDRDQRRGGRCAPAPRAPRRRERQRVREPLLLRGLDRRTSCPRRRSGGSSPGSARSRSCSRSALSMERYELFLFLIGSVFVPLFGVFARRLVRARPRPLRRGAAVRADRRPMARARAVARGLRPVPVERADGTGRDGSTRSGTCSTGGSGCRSRCSARALGASLPSFAAAFGLALLLRGAEPDEGGAYSVTERRVGGGAATSRITAGSRSRCGS